jgi:hypothetical protein
MQVCTQTPLFIIYPFIEKRVKEGKRKKKRTQMTERGDNSFYNKK